MDYSTACIHPHDLVFQQMLRSAHLPNPSLYRPSDITMRPLPERRSTLPPTMTSIRGQYAYDSEVDDGYHADRDNKPKRLLKVTSDVFLEITPSTTRKTRCTACHAEIRASSYRLRLLDTSESLHVACFESQFNLEQGFGRIYPAPLLNPSNPNRTSEGLDDAARELVKAWKMQRRREGLKDAAGPDTGVPCGIAADPQHDEGKRIGEKRSSVEIEDDIERKRARVSRRHTVSHHHSSIGGPSPIIGNDDGGDKLVRTSFHARAGSMAGMTREEGSNPDLYNLPMRLTDALKRIEGVPRRFTNNLVPCK
ncbi:hypothetical protein FRB99_000932 [Tulasnella sp. 403]|nr:hypothetical protein FRB99_000932 [Tulasnella sp. 403]